MARLARVVIPDLPSPITQRGNDRAQTFFGDDDCQLYLDLLRKHCAEAQVSIWGKLSLYGPYKASTNKKGVLSLHRISEEVGP